MNVTSNSSQECLPKIIGHLDPSKKKRYKSRRINMKTLIEIKEILARYKDELKVRFKAKEK